MVRYECVMAALAVRESRCLPRYERLREAISIPLRFEGGSHWKVMSEVDQSAIEAGSGMPDKLLVPDDEEGERLRRSPFPVGLVGASIFGAPGFRSGGEP